MERFLLEMEHKYWLIGGHTTIDQRSATIKEPPAAHSGNGKCQSEDLRTAAVEVAGADK